MMGIRIVVFAVGLSLVAWTLLSAIRTVVLPRGAQSAITRVVFRTFGRLFRMAAGARPTFERQDRVMALFSPVSLLALAVVWVILVDLGYMLMYWSVQQAGWAEAYFLSGSSLLTLGFAPAEGLTERILAFSEATIGLGLVALLIAFLPAIYSSFQRRERKVGELEVRAGSPPTATEFLTRHHSIGWLEDMSGSWLDWEAWFLEIQEAHTSYPALVFFRSPIPEQHWVTAAGTVLDAAALLVAVCDTGSQPEARVTIRAGWLALRRIASFFGIDFDPDPQPDDPISIRRVEFDLVYDRLAEAGLPLVADRDQAWKDWAGWRVNYDSVLLQLAELTMAPYAPWTSDRSSPGHTAPRIRRWGVRKQVRTSA
ncbi:MAG: hypothetical protein OEX04_05385 [Acidimicrobiia bacterium]|nr:hypothetical protein [Acidimicrobiia bacterium]